MNQDECLARGCCWDPNADLFEDPEPTKEPYCYYPAGRVSYELLNVTKGQMSASVYYSLQTPSGHPKDLKIIKMDIIATSDESLQIKVRYFKRKFRDLELN